jgi:predicted DNA-binding transcriptional regulator AlpA
MIKKPNAKRVARVKSTTRAKKAERGKHPNSHKPYKPRELPPLPPLSPNEIVRWVDGPRYFGSQHTQMQLFIKLGKIPAPIVLCGRARGWLGSTIIEWQQKRAQSKVEED